MENKYEKLYTFFERIKVLTLWQRIFNWKELKALSYEAYEEYKTIFNSFDIINKELAQTKSDIAVYSKDREHLRTNKSELEKGNAILTEKAEQLNQEITVYKKENIIFKQTDDARRKDHEDKINILTSELERIRNERIKEQAVTQQNEIQRIQAMKQTWAKHQENVSSTIKMICQKQVIEYIEKVPFRGSPDNTIKVCDEYVIFDAKSPSNDDLQNFPQYIKIQTESIKKYIKEENVRKDIFLVVPSSTVEVIKQFTYNMADYTVYIVTIDVLEPLILTLKKIEEYEFINQLSPDERDNICRIIGKFAHMTKRRIQVDHFFAWEYLDILTKCKVDIPRDLMAKVIEYEKSEKVNPPQERRSKQILTKELETDNEKVQKEAEAKEIIFPPSVQQGIRNMAQFTELWVEK